MQEVGHLRIVIFPQKKSANRVQEGTPEERFKTQTDAVFINNDGKSEQKYGKINVQQQRKIVIIQIWILELLKIIEMFRNFST